MHIRTAALEELHQDPSNARAHGESNMAAIEASLSRFGQAEPLIVQEATGRVIGGNGRLAAMKKLGWDECEVVELDLDDLQATALAIALNRTAELAEWDGPVLARLLSQIRDDDSLDGLGYTDDDIDALLADLEDGENDGVDDPGPEEPPEEPVSRTGDLWILGDHLLLCGDSTSLEDVQRVMGDDQANLVATDPPEWFHECPRR